MAPSEVDWRGWQVATLGGGLCQRLQVAVPDAVSGTGEFAAKVRAACLEAARQLARDLATVTDDEIARAERLIADLGEDSRQIVVISGGATSLANQAIAQWAGWNIPGVGEGEQRFRPRTRIYDTLDPDTIRQVTESLAYERTSFLFVLCPTRPEPARLWGQVLAPQIRTVYGRDMARHVGVVGSAAGDLFAGGEAQCVSFDASAGALSIPALLTGLARGLKADDVRLGARNVAEAAAGTAAAGSPIWLDVRSRLQAGASASAGDHVMLAWGDRLARLVASAGESSNRIGRGCWTSIAGSEAVSGRDPVTLGLHLEPRRERAVDIFTVAQDDEGPVGRFAAQELQRFAAIAEMECGAVRVLEASDYSAASYGALVARLTFEANVLAAVNNAH